MFAIEPMVAMYSVTQLNRHIRQWLERDVGVVGVTGEISNLSQPSSGHVYFTLKDQTAQLRCVYFKPYHPRQNAPILEHGQHIVVRGRLSVYEARGDYQLIVESLALEGLGDLYQQYEKLKNKLAALGWFEAARKRPIPRFPQCIGVVTSPHAAAWRDIMATLAIRYPLAEVVLYPSDVQGKLAAPQLRAALEKANAQGRCDVVILARGGGSLEDLWAFNDEALALAIKNSTIPVICGIGHETDFTIADFVADWRAATPTAAAQVATPDQADLMRLLTTLQQRLRDHIRAFITQKQNVLQRYQTHLTSPHRAIATHVQTLDYLERRLQAAWPQRMTQMTHQLNTLTTRMHAQHPQRVIQNTLARVNAWEVYFFQWIRQYIELLKKDLHRQASTLNAVSPLATLERGYAVATQQGHVMIDAQQVNVNEPLDVRLARGALRCRVII